MIHLIIAVVVLVGTLYFVISMIVLVCRVIWLCVLLVALCVMACLIVVLAMAVGVQKLMQLRKPQVEILPPDWPDPRTKDVYS